MTAVFGIGAQRETDDGVTRGRGDAAACPLPCGAGPSEFAALTRSHFLSGRVAASPYFGVLMLLCVCAASLLPSGCSKQSGDEGKTVTLYTSVDEPFAREVVAEFEKQVGIKVQLVTDTEAGKTTGLVRKIEAERVNPRADVFWSSELFNTIRLARAGLLVEYRPPAEGIPDRYKDSAGRWTAFGTRGRVLCYNTKNVQAVDVPSTWRGMADPKWKDKLAVADPRFGTTTGQVAAMYALWGEAEYTDFLKRLNETTGGLLMDGNATVARRVGAGEMLIGATDTDDVYARQGRSEPIAMVYPDMGDGGTLLIPNSVGLVEGAPHPAAAKKLIDFLTSETTERMLARSESRNFPVREKLRQELKIELPPETKVPFDKIAEALEPAIRLAGEHLVH
jgi:iron(III) transport system substrate-binding protein